jgi:hypothetical protein
MRRSNRWTRRCSPGPLLGRPTGESVQTVLKAELARSDPITTNQWRRCHVDRGVGACRLVGDCCECYHIWELW